ncbi:SPOR domain-containing protein [Nannocystaceae bacterium ST9]
MLLTLTSLLSQLDGAVAPLLDPIVDASSPSIPATIQIDRFEDPGQAEALAEQLRGRMLAAGIAASVGVSMVESDTLVPSFVVEVGPFGDLDHAEATREALAELGVQGFVRESTYAAGC